MTGLLKKSALIVSLCFGLCSCGVPGHHGTPSDPNEQQGNPDAHPEQSINQRSNKQPDGDKTGKDPHTLTRDRNGAPAK